MEADSLHIGKEEANEEGRVGEAKSGRAVPHFNDFLIDLVVLVFPEQIFKHCKNAISGAVISKVDHFVSGAEAKDDIAMLP